MDKPGYHLVIKRLPCLGSGSPLGNHGPPADAVDALSTRSEYCFDVKPGPSTDRQHRLDAMSLPADNV